MRCPKCGAEIKEGARFCGKCGMLLSEASAAAARPAARPAAKPAARPRSVLSDVNRMPQGIALGVDERVVKQYKIGRYSFRQGFIYVLVTNKRVIRYEESTLFGMQNNQIDEINIDAVHGITTRMRRSISILGVFFTLIFFVLGCVCLNFDSRYGYGQSGGTLVGVILLLVALAILVGCFKPTLEFGVLGSVGNNVLGTLVNSRGRWFRNDSNSVLFQFVPTEETTIMLKEIGACIYDLKTLGDAAIEKWSHEDEEAWD